MSQFSYDFPSFSNWIEVVRHQATLNNDKAAYTFLPDGDELECHLTYRQLDARARAVAARLQSLNLFGQRALLLYPPGLEYIVAFIGCLYAGVTAVPAYPPQSSKAKRSLPRLHSIMDDAKPAVILTIETLLNTGKPLFSAMPGSNSTQWLATDTISDDSAAEWIMPDIKPDTLAFLQYTSGSTTAPKGVKITHRNLLYNEWIICNAFEHGDESVVAGWLPFYHDMGLIGNVLQPLYRGIPCLLMPPIAFLKNPFKWLATISRYKVTTSGAPNFAYDLCVEKISPADCSKLDLSCWKVAFNGAEPIRHETVERFIATFEPYGFSAESFYPCYGLAEATLIVSGGKKSLRSVIRAFNADSIDKQGVAIPAPDNQNGRKLVGCGKTLGNQRIIIVDPESRVECMPGKIGEIWVTGESVATGYWQREEQTVETFQAQTAPQQIGPCLRTGDLGFFLEDELFIAGRLKDLIIIRGRNHYPQDIELTAEQAHPAIRAGCGAAFSVEIGGEERLVVVHEIERLHRHSNLETVAAAVRQAIIVQHELLVHTVVLIKPGGIPKTSSGKIQRHACRIAFLNNTFDTLIQDAAGDSSTAMNDEPSTPNTPITFTGSRVEDLSHLETYLLGQVAKILNTDCARLSPNKSIYSYGLDSLRVIDLASRIETDLGVSLSVAEIFVADDLPAVAAAILDGVSTAALRKSSKTIDDKLVESAIVLAENGRGIVRASPAQESLWLLHQTKSNQSVAFNILVPIRLKGLLQVELLEKSINEIIRRHGILRTSYLMREGHLFQIVAPVLTLSLTVHDLGELPENERETHLSRLGAEQAQYFFNLETGPLLKTTLCRISREEHVLLLALHHLACDGWSIRIFLQELTLLYEAFSANETSPLIEMPEQYSDFIQRHGHIQPDNEQARDLNYWQHKLSGDLPECYLPVDFARDTNTSLESARIQFRITSHMVQAIKVLSRGEAATPFMILLAAFKALLFRFSGQEDLLVGSSVANRNGARSQEIMGPFTNAIALRTRLGDNPSFQKLLHRVKQVTLEAFTHQTIPFDKVWRETKRHQRPGRDSLFDVVFLFQDFITPAWNLHKLSARLEEFDDGLSNFDLALFLYQHEWEWIGSLKYKTDLFHRETIQALANSYAAILDQIVKDPEIPLDQLEIGGSSAARPQSTHRRNQQRTIAIAATFTAELLESSLSFWMRELKIPARIEFAPYHQVFQQLLNPESLFFKNENGVNLILIRSADWEHHTKNGKTNSHSEEKSKKTFQDFIAALKSATFRSQVPFFVCLCPVSPEETKGKQQVDPDHLIETQFMTELEGQKGVYFICQKEFAETYPVAAPFDDYANALGHVPFSQTFFTALGTLLARKIQALCSHPYKVIVLDCDQTLWTGVCAEDGALGVKVDSPRKYLQQFMLAQYSQGMLLCLCSKNNAADVEEVFIRHSDMQLTLDHFVAKKIDWEPKSANLKALAHELGLGLDSFIFLDDSAVECAEIRATCPSVLALQLPQNPQKIPDFLNHIWAFDHLKVTAEDKKRTGLYRQNFQREELRKQSITLEAFLSGLELHCDFREMTPGDIARAAQLTQRTNQFNTTGIQHSETDLHQLSKLVSHTCIVVEAKDRFGDYGLVGMLLTAQVEGALKVDSFLLSCRALGRRIEHQMLLNLGKLGSRLGLNQIEIRFIPTNKNSPAFDFLESIAGTFKMPRGSGFSYVLSVNEAIAARCQTAGQAFSPPAVSSKTNSPIQFARQANWEEAVRIATQFGNIASIERSIQMQCESSNPKIEVYVEPHTPTEKTLTEIWQEILQLDRVGIRDNFFELGGHSLIGTVLVSRIRKTFDVELPLQSIFEHTTIETLAIMIEEELIGQLGADEIAAAMEEINMLSDNEIDALLKREAPPSKTTDAG